MTNNYATHRQTKREKYLSKTIRSVVFEKESSRTSLLVLVQEQALKVLNFVSVEIYLKLASSRLTTNNFIRSLLFFGSLVCLSTRLGVFGVEYQSTWSFNASRDLFRLFLSLLSQPRVT